MSSRRILNINGALPQQIAKVDTHTKVTTSAIDSTTQKNKEIVKNISDIILSSLADIQINNANRQIKVVDLILGRIASLLDEKFGKISIDDISSIKTEILNNIDDLSISLSNDDRKKLIDELSLLLKKKEKIKDILKFFEKTFKDNKLVQNAQIELLNESNDYIKKTLDDILSKIKQINNNIDSLKPTVLSTIVGMIPSITGIFKQINSTDKEISSLNKNISIISDKTSINEKISNDILNNAKLTFKNILILSKEISKDIWKYIKNINYASIWKYIKKFSTNIWNWSKKFSINLWNWTKDNSTKLLNWTADNSDKLWNWTKDNSAKLWKWSKNFSSSLWNWTTNNSDKLWNLTANNSAKLWNWTKDNSTKLWNATKKYSGNLWNWTKDNSVKFWNAIKKYSGNLWNWTKVSSTNLWKWSKKFSSNFWNWTKDNSSKLWNKIKNLNFTTIWKLIKTSKIWKFITNTIFPALIKLGKNFWSWLSKINWQKIWNLLINTLKSVWNLLKSVDFGAIGAWIKTTSKSIWNKLLKINWSNVIKRAKDLLLKIWNWLKSLATKIWNWISGIFSEKPTTDKPTDNNIAATANTEQSKKSIFQRIKKFVSDIFDIIDKINNVILPWFIENKDIIASIIKWINDILLPFIEKTIMPFINDTLLPFINNELLPWFRRISAKIEDFVDNLLTNIKNFIRIYVVAPLTGLKRWLNAKIIAFKNSFWLPMFRFGDPIEFWPEWVGIIIGALKNMSFVKYYPYLGAEVPFGAGSPAGIPNLDNDYSIFDLVNDEVQKTKSNIEVEKVALKTEKISNSVNLQLLKELTDNYHKLDDILTTTKDNNCKLIDISDKLGLNVANLALDELLPNIIEDSKRKITLDDIDTKITTIFDFLTPFANATRLNFENILLKLDEKPNLVPIPFTNTEFGNTALMENM